MNLALDHLIITVNNLDDAITAYRQNGYLVHYGGQHVGGGTHNALVVFADGTYLELLAKTRPDATTSYEAYFAHGEGYAGFALWTDDIQACHDALLEKGYAVPPIRVGGRTRVDGVPLQWRVMPVGDASFPFLIEDVAPRNLRVPFDHSDWMSHPNNARGIASVMAKFDPLRIAALQVLLEISAVELLKQTDRISFQLGHTHFLIAEATDAQEGEQVELTVLYAERGT